jgi:hypothetical protein
MLYDVLKKSVKKHFYITYFEKFKSESSEYYIERYVAKHPLLKPKLIVHNDEPYGFKNVTKTVASLENFPIYCEYEYLIDEDGEKVIENFDLYSETHLKISDKIIKAIELSKNYANTLSVERINSLNNQAEQMLVISSNLFSFLLEKLEQDFLGDRVNTLDIEAGINTYFKNFNDFIQKLDTILTK